MKHKTSLFVLCFWSTIFAVVHSCQRKSSLTTKANGEVRSPGLFQQEGEVCGPCYSLETFDCGECAKGLECVEDERAYLVPDLPSRCRLKIEIGMFVDSEESNEFYGEKEKLKFKIRASRNIEQPPTIHVLFENGDQDELELSHYKMNEKATAGCNYLGHLRSDPSSNVAVTGCLSQPGDHLEVTIVSPDKINKMFKVDYDGNAEIIKNPFENGAESVYIQPDRREVAEWHRILDEEVSFNLEERVEKTYASNPSITMGKMPQKLKATIWFGYEDGLKAALGNQDFDTWIQGVLTHTQAHYRHKKSLGTTIEFEVAGNAMHKKGVTWTADDNIWNAESASLAAYNSGKIADSYSWWCNSGGGKTAGIAFRGTLCRTQGSNTNLNEMQETVAASGFVLSHELGHNFGMHHDFDKYHGGDGTPGTGPCDGKGIMSYGSKDRYQWSTCSRSDFELHYWALNWGNGCLDDISNSCNDTDYNATDTWGDGCDWYQKIPEACGKYDDVDFYANVMCCKCKAQGFGEKWGNWVAWSECSASCGGGNQTRTRTCVKRPVFGAINDCTGPKSETKGCGISPCDLTLWPRTGENKYCTSHQFANEDEVEDQKSCQHQCELVDDCVGITYSNKPGNSRYCYICLNEDLRDAANGFSFYKREEQANSPVDGNWAVWGQWASCSRSCGDGTRTRTRTCTSPPPSETGNTCEGASSQTETCRVKTCPATSCKDSYPKNYQCKKKISCSKLAKKKKCTKSFKSALPTNCEKRISSTDLKRRVNLYCKKSCRSC